MKIVAYVLDKNGKPLMPCHSYGRVKKWLKKKETKIVKYKPFTIQFFRETTHNVDKCILGIDPGRTNIGLCVINEKGEELFSSNVVTRNKQIPNLMEERLGHRQLRRKYRRLRRKRRFLKYNPQLKNNTIIRRLPHYSVDVEFKLIKNKQSRFCNRKRKEGWLTPTATQLLRTHVNLVKKIQKFLPISEITLELNSFDFAKMENPNIKNWEYQKGKLFGFKNKNEYVSHQQDGHCLFCKHNIEYYHHVVWLSKGGSDTVDNIAGVCLKHHDLIHKEQKWDDKCVQKHGGLLKKYGALSVLNQIKNQLVEQLSNIFPLNCTTGFETYRIRNDLILNKDHYIDAWCIAVSSLKRYNAPIIENKYDIKQFRRHDRQIVNKNLDRYYKQKTKTICQNRRKQFGQKNNSLKEFLEKNPQFTNMIIDVNKVRKNSSFYRMVHSSNMIFIYKGSKSFANRHRIMPGVEFLYQGKRYIADKQSKGKYFYSNNFGEKSIPIKDCIILKRNVGLVFV